MIEKIYFEETIKDEDLNKFVKKPEVKELYNKLKQDDGNYTISIDIASNKSKDFSCMSYFKKNQDGNLIFVESKIIK